ncbi:MAG: glucosaminidase domain-containing protein [Eubacteriales bacterium]|nr:glucosaminidase domain-containing protein [Eubacteriales bacterium]
MKEQQEFIEKVAYYVKKYAKKYGILVHSPIIAQAILESGWGKSTLSSKYHNYFGMKCRTKWTGKSVNMTTQEEYQVGVQTTIKDNFRVYDSMKDGIKGYFEFIQLPRYSNLKGITDPLTYLETIKADGYATSSTYVKDNMKVIEQYDLTRFDKKEGNIMYSRKAVIKQAKAWYGCKESDGTHRKIIDVYNKQNPLPRGYRVTYRDAWCATYVSAVSLILGYTKIIPTECGCNQMIEKFKKIGCWVEDDSYVPQEADIVFYDWDDTGEGDCIGGTEHVGFVESVSGGYATIIEGNIRDSVGRRKLKINGRYIRGYAVPKYDDEPASAPEPSKPDKSVDKVAREVLEGKWGNGSERKRRLIQAGYNFDAVQKKVNWILSGKKSLEAVAKEVIAGKWGNGEARRKKLEASGYDADEVQKTVNRILS